MKKFNSFRKKFSYLIYGFSKKWNSWTSIVLLAATAIGFFGGGLSYLIRFQNSIPKSTEKVDPVQKRLSHYQQSGTTPFLLTATGSEGVDISTDDHEKYDLSNYYGKDLSEIGVKTLVSDDKSVYYTQDLPYTGIIATNASSITLTKSEHMMMANAYDFVNLKYVRYDKETKTIDDIKYAPPPGLFADDTWPEFKEANNDFNTLFPTATIRNAIKQTLGVTSNTFSKIEWFNALNKPNITLDLSNNSLNSIAEIFNPNLRWGLGIYDLLATANNGWKSNQNWTTENNSNDNYTILYRGVGLISVNNNNLTHFPNPNFKNFPALRSISANNNAIQAIGNFNTFSNTAPITEYKTDAQLKAETSLATTAVNYYQYLTELWADDSDVKDLAAVVAIKKWLTTILPSKSYLNNQSTRKSGNKIINDYNSFLEAVSGDNFYFKNDAGDVYVNQRSGATISDNNANNKTPAENGIVPFDSESQVETDNTGILKLFIKSVTTTFNKGINFGGVKLAITKDINTLDFSNNQIQRIPLSKNLFTNINFANNKLRYITPIALQPLPWFYPASFVWATAVLNLYAEKQNFNPNEWNQYYNQTTETKPSGWSKFIDARPRMGNENVVPPSLNFSANQLLDFWPQQIQRDSWYTWPKFAAPTSDKDATSIQSNVNGYPIAPWNNQIGLTAEFYPWFHRLWIGLNVTESVVLTYMGSFGPGLDYKTPVTSNIPSLSLPQNLYSYFFKQLTDNKNLSFLQSFSKSFIFDLSKTRPFVLPGFATNANKAIGVTNFDDTSPLKGTTDAYKSYNSFVPYIFTRALPQNFSTINSWGKSNGIDGDPQKINVTMTNADDGSDMTPTEFSNIDWVSFYTNANGLNYNDDKTQYKKADLTTNYKPSAINRKFTTDANNGNDVLTKIVGQLPYLQGRKNAVDWKDSSGKSSFSNVAAGLEKTLFEITRGGTKQTPNRINLKIEAPLQQWKYEYQINLIENLNYTITPLHVVSGHDQQEDISKSNFSKKDDFSHEITARELALEVKNWANLSSYVQNFISNNLDTALTIKSFDIKKGELVVGFNINDINNIKINTIPDITIINFATQKSFFLNDTTDIINSLDQAASNQFVPENETKAREWIKDKIGVRWIGLELNQFTPTSETSAINPHITTTNPIPTTSSVLTTERNEKLKSLNAKGIFTINQLKNADQYINNVIIDKVNGRLSFTLFINGSAANGNIPLVQNVAVNGFNRFDFSVDTSSFIARSKSLYDFYDSLTSPNDFSELHQFVKLKTIKTTFPESSFETTPTAGGGSGVTSETVKIWEKTKSFTDLQNENLLPKGTELSIKINNAIADQGILNFEVVWYSVEGDAKRAIRTRTGNINSFLTFNSTFEWKQNNDRFSLIAIIPYETYKNKKPSEFKNALNVDVTTFATATDSESKKEALTTFSSKIIPLIDLSKTAPKAEGSAFSNTEAISLADDKVKQLVFGFGIDVNLTAELVAKNVTADDVSLLTTIKNLAVKGGYKNGKFFAGTDAHAPVYHFPEIRVAFAPNTTQVKKITDDYNTTKSSEGSEGSASSSSSPAEKKLETQANYLFEDALKKTWNKLLPSEWLKKLQNLKLQQSSTKPPKVNYDTYDNLTGFLNHVLTTTTSNSGYQTRIDITNDVNAIKINDTTGKITIPANTLLIVNNYADSTNASRDLAAKPYDEEIIFTLSNFFSAFDADTIARLPFDQATAINARFSTLNVTTAIKRLKQLFATAKVLYDATDAKTITDKQKADAITAINSLKFRFIAPEYINNQSVNRYFSEPFAIGDLSDSKKNGKYIEFSSISFSNIDYIKGELEVKVKISNYVNGYVGAGYSIEDKEKTFKLTNLLGLRLQPTWIGFHPYDTTLFSTNSKLIPVNNQQISGYVTQSGFKTQSAQVFYASLMQQPSSLGSAYVQLINNKTSAALLDLVTWQLVDSTGIKVNFPTDIPLTPTPPAAAAVITTEAESSPKPTDAASALQAQALKTLLNEMTKANATFNVKKSDVYVDTNLNRIIIMNPFISFTNQQVGIKAVSDSIFDSRKINPTLVQANGQYFNLALSNIILEGFSPKPIAIQSRNYDESNYLLDFTDSQVSVGDILPSEIYAWLIQNYAHKNKINRFLHSFYQILGSSSLLKPIELILNPEFQALLAKQATVKEASNFIAINDGLGQLNFLATAVLITNTYKGVNTQTINNQPVNLSGFFANKQSEYISLAKLKFENSQVLFEDNPIGFGSKTEILFADGVNNDIRIATNQLLANNFAIAYKYLQLNSISVSPGFNTSQKLIITGISPNLFDGTIRISYQIENGYHNGVQQTLSNNILLSGFTSNTRNFFKVHLPWVIVVVLLGTIGLFFFLRYYLKIRTTIKYTNIHKAFVTFFISRKSKKINSFFAFNNQKDVLKQKTIKKQVLKNLKPNSPQILKEHSHVKKTP